MDNTENYAIRKKGLCILSSEKKKTFLSDPKFLQYKGFKVCDEADNGIQLWYLPFVADAPLPEFKECKGTIREEIKSSRNSERNVFPYRRRGKGCVFL